MSCYYGEIFSKIADFFQKKMVSQGPTISQLDTFFSNRMAQTWNSHCRFTASLYPRLILVLSLF